MKGDLTTGDETTGEVISGNAVTGGGVVTVGVVTGDVGSDGAISDWGEKVRLSSTGLLAGSMSKIAVVVGMFCGSDVWLPNAGTEVLVGLLKAGDVNGRPS